MLALRATCLCLACACGACGSAASAGAKPGAGAEAGAGPDGTAGMDGSAPLGADGSLDAGGSDGVGAELGSDAGSSIVTTKRWPDSPTVFCATAVSLAPTCPTAGQNAFGQDGNYLIDVMRLTSMGDTVREAITGLVWDHRAMRPTAMDQSSAIAHCQGLSLGGFSDWRLPTLLELVSLIDYGRHDPATDPALFSNEVDWAAHPAGETVDFSVGAVTPAAATESHAVRCVRGTPLESSLVRAGQTVVDVGLGLEWQHASAPAVLPWEKALDYCVHSSVAGHTDWRLASIKELLTLFSLDKAGTVTFAAGLIDAAGASTQPFFYSSTPGAGEMPTGEAPEMKGWVADIYNGSLEAGPTNGLSGSAIALCVRR